VGLLQQRSLDEIVPDVLRAVEPVSQSTVQRYTEGLEGVRFFV
jgi:hypothetical protein